jgi:hypothetical protein
LFDKCHLDKKSAILFSDPAKYTARTSNSCIAAIKHNSLKQQIQKKFYTLVDCNLHEYIAEDLFFKFTHDW